LKSVVNFGIIGCGGISMVHIAALKAIENAELVAVSDVFEPNLKKTAGEQRVDGYPDYHDMLKRCDIDAVIILTSNGTHAEIGIEAAQAGKSIVVEKPIDVTVEKAMKLIEACRENNVVLSCIFQHRFDPAVIAIKEAVEKGWLGKIYSCCCHTKWYRTQEYYDSVPWRGTLALDGGGALINQSIHYIDLMQYIMGGVKEVFGYTGTFAHKNIEGEDTGMAVVKFKTGAIGLIEGTTSAYPGFSCRLDIHGCEGSIMLEDDAIKYWKLMNGREPDMNLQTDMVSSHQKQLQNITDAILNDSKPEVTGSDALSALAIVQGIYCSVRKHRPVAL
jgi:Predicted dehydrogenases and related proteins